ncbi:MAG: putative O-glycosylation ligase, exosortase A system-associated [Burkholderiales bacterium]|nr:putative O-glycosylation ligase, exosortase A system-associated [Burkholderiales bacterium]
MRDLFVASVVFGSLPFILRRPFWGILLMAWLGYMNPHRLCYGFMLNVQVVQIVAITTLLGMLLSKEPKRMIWSREIVVLALFVLWMGVTTIFALYPDSAWEKYVFVIKIQILTVMTLMLLTDKERIRAFVWVIVLSLGFYGVKGGIFTIVHGGVYHVEGPAGTFIGGNNELALALIMTVPLMRYLQLQEPNKFVKMGLTGGMLLSIISAIGSQSRGALVGLLITGTIFWAKSRRKLVSGVLIVVATLVVVSLMPEAWYQRMDTIDTYQQDASAMGRINAWHTAWNLAKARFTGGGYDMWTPEVFRVFAPHPEDVHDAHSIYFKVLGEHGFVGLILFVLLLALSWGKCRKIIRAVGKNAELLWARDLAAMIQVSMVAYFSAGAFLGLSYYDYIYHLIALTVVLYALVQAAPAVARAPAQGPGLRLSAPARLPGPG